MKSAVVAILAVASAAVAQGSKTHTIEGKEVVLDGRYVAGPLVEVRDLKFYSCRLAKDGNARTIVSGYVVSHLQHDAFTITLRIDLYVTNKQHRYAGEHGGVSVVVERPKPGEPRRFVALAPRWLPEAANGKKQEPKLTYVINYSIGNYDFTP